MFKKFEKITIRWIALFTFRTTDPWCGFMRDRANGTKDYKHAKGLPIPVVTAIKPIYASLSDNKLLQKCLDCKTQNQNESFNGMIWNRLPKTVFVGSDVLHLSVYDEVSHFNIGASASIKILEKMGISSGDYCLLGCSLADKQRVRSANRNSEESKKKRRRMIRPEEKPKETSRSKNKGRNMPVENFKL